MPVRGIDTNIMIQKVPEAAKLKSQQENNLEAFQKNLAEQTKIKAERAQQQVGATQQSQKTQVGKDQKERNKGSNGKGKTMERHDPDHEVEENDEGQYKKGSNIDIRI